MYGSRPLSLSEGVGGRGVRAKWDMNVSVFKRLVCLLGRGKACMCVCVSETPWYCPFRRVGVQLWFHCLPLSIIVSSPWVLLTGSFPSPLLSLFSHPLPRWLLIENVPKRACEHCGSEGSVKVDPLTLICVLFPHGKCLRASSTLSLSPIETERKTEVWAWRPDPIEPSASIDPFQICPEVGRKSAGNCLLAEWLRRKAATAKKFKTDIFWRGQDTKVLNCFKLTFIFQIVIVMDKLCPNYPLSFKAFPVVFFSWWCTS